jgi:DNA-binding helix-hairpin-helix protein with protein kinase domain
MTHLYDIQGRAIPLGSELASGGEGTIHEFGPDDAFVAKVYHKPISDLKADKLRCMTALDCPDLRSYAAWPVATLHERPGGRVAGIVLPRVKEHEEIHNLYSPAHRKMKYPDKDWEFLVHVAMNCAAAFDAIHGKSCVIGDVNQGNVLVSQQGMVYLIDCDSFQVSGGGKTYFCEVGVPEYTPPELQGQSFHDVRRTVNHDCFGLAVLVFHLLFMGRHPFAGRFLGRGDMPIQRAIGEFRFAFGRTAAERKMARPPDTLPLDQVAPDLIALFERAFAGGSVEDGARPAAQEWRAALFSLKHQLRACGDDRGHKFHRQLAACPWCEIARAGGPNFFISITIHLTTVSQFTVSADIPQLWREIENIRPPKAAYQRPPPRPKRLVVPNPVEPAAASSAGLTVFVRVAIAACFVLAFISWLFQIQVLAYASLPAFAGFSLWWAVLLATSPYFKEKNRRWWSLRQAKSSLKKVKGDWQKTSNYYQNKFYDHFESLIGKRNAMNRLNSDYSSDLQKLKQDCAARQLAHHLQSKFISDHAIDLITPGIVSLLASYGIETACDIKRNSLQRIPGFTAVMTNNLIAWQRQLKDRFCFDPAKGVPPNEIQALNLKYVNLSHKYETALLRGCEELQGIVAESNQKLARLDRQIAEAENHAAQAEADLAVMK